MHRTAKALQTITSPGTDSQHDYHTIHKRPSAQGSTTANIPAASSKATGQTSCKNHRLITTSRNSAATTCIRKDDSSTSFAIGPRVGQSLHTARPRKGG